jgi:hypothetical protein
MRRLAGRQGNQEDHDRLRALDAGRDVLTGGDGPDVVVEDHGDDPVNGGGGADLLAVGIGSDIAQGGLGNDFLAVLHDGRPDTVRCGDGHDVVVYLEERDRMDRYRACEEAHTYEEFEEMEGGGFKLLVVPPAVSTP